MKKIYLLAVSALIGSASFGQLTYDLELNLVSPASGTSVAAGAAVPVSFTFINNGPSTIPGGDTLFFAYANMTTQALYSLTNVANQATGVILPATMSLTPGTAVPSSVLPGSPFSFNLSGFAPGTNVAVIFLGAGMDALSQAGDAQETTPNNNADVFTIASPTSGIEMLDGDKIAMYPVPATDELNIEFGTDAVSTVNVVNLNGQVVSSTAANNGSVKLNVAELKSGLYIYQAVDANGNVVATDKFSKK